MEHNKRKYYLCRIILALMLMAAAETYGQSSGQNYIVTETMLDAAGTRSAKSVQYFDGLGRSDVLAAGGVNTSGKYVYSVTEYDLLGREHRTWLPAAGTTTPDITDATGMASLSGNTYNDARSFSETQYDALGRPVYRSTPGESWDSKGVTTEYISNDSNSVRRYSLDTSGMPQANSGYYGKGTLTGERTTDEDGHTIEVYRDLTGNMVLERRDGNNDTYYVYESGLLRVVIPPLWQSRKLNSLLYWYKYDDHGRCIEKNLPGCQTIRYKYDRYGRLAFVKDYRMSLSGKCRYYLYDGLNRLVVQGMCSSGSFTRNSAYAADATYGEGEREICNTNYYVASDYVLTSPTIEIVNYYDGYDCISSGAFGSVASKWNMSAQSSVCTTTLLTAQIVTDNKGNRYYRTMRYDDMGRCVETVSTSADDYCIKTSTSYSFTDKVTKTVTRTYRNSISNLQHTLVDSVSYDALCDQPEKECIWLDNNPMEIVADNTYDNLGRLTESRSGNGNISNQYQYDLHGWLTNHQNFDTSLSSEPLFSERLYYADGPNTERCYNGNISAQVYTDARGNAGKGYRFSYDGLNRLTTAQYAEGQDLSLTPQYDFSESVEYNANSSITHLQRTGKSLQGPAVIDNITFTYSGNKLSRARDTGTAASLMGDAFHFVDGYNSATEYSYDGCGALTKDKNKGIYQITYDFNGMPTCVWFDNGSITDYVYTSDGVKLKTVHRTAVDGTTASGSTPQLSGQNTLSKDSTLYIGAMEVYNGTQEKYYFSNGYMDIGQNGLESYNYYAKDHLGNVRHVERTAPGTNNQIVQVVNYYPFGGLLNDGPSSLDVQNKLYNGKELDRMHGLNWYDFHARQQDAALGMFTSMDPLCEKYYNVSPYAYCVGNPVNAVDPDGKLVIFINGFHNGFQGASSSYWNGFDRRIIKHFKEGKYPIYYDGSLGGIMGLSLIHGNQITYTLHSQPFNSSNISVGARYNAGFEQGKSSAAAIFASLDRDDDGKIKEAIRIISHSMGGAYAKGYAQALIDYSNNHPDYCNSVNIVEYDFAPFQPNAQKAVEGVETYQYSHHYDKVAKDAKIEGAHYHTSNEKNKGHSISDFIDYINRLPDGRKKF